MAKVPEHLVLVRDFLDTVDLEQDLDDLGTVPEFRLWLAGHGWARISPMVTEAGLAHARELRDALREEIRHHHDQTVGDRSAVDRLAATVPLHTRFTPEGVRLEPAGEGLAELLGTVLAAITLGAQDGTWRRVKICREDTCQEPFYDQSKNASRTWCSMQVCGNRNKIRAYRGRQSGQDGG